MSVNHKSISGSILYADFTGSGIHEWNGTTWSQLNVIDPANMAASGSTLYVSGLAGGSGVWQWNGTAWSHLNGIDPARMVASGSNLYADGTGSGIYEWNGTAWSQVTPNDPTVMAGF